MEEGMIHADQMGESGDNKWAMRYRCRIDLLRSWNTREGVHHGGTWIL